MKLLYIVFVLFSILACTFACMRRTEEELKVQKTASEKCKEQQALINDCINKLPMSYRQKRPKLVRVWIDSAVALAQNQLNIFASIDFDRLNYRECYADFAAYKVDKNMCSTYDETYKEKDYVKENAETNFLACVRYKNIYNNVRLYLTVPTLTFGNTLTHTDEE